MKGLLVPNQLILGQSATLECNYHLEGSNLYSVKWYKNGEEFFRWMPSMEEKMEVFPVAGVSVDVSMAHCLCLHPPPRYGRKRPAAPAGSVSTPSGWRRRAPTGAR